MASSINVAVELAEPNCNEEAILEPLSRKYSLRNGNEGVVAA